jgi:hypothetical protein
MTMPSYRLKKLSTSGWLAGLLAAVPMGGALAQSEASAPAFVWTQPEQVWPRYFRLGVLAGFNLKADFSMNGQFGVSGGQPGPVGVSGADHLYDDGYVRVDQTGNAGGYTSYWGYNDASQLSGNTLTFHSAKSFTANSGPTSATDSAVGVDLAYGGHLFPWRRAQVGWEFGFGYLPVNIEDQQTFSGVVNRTVHTFDTGGIVVPTAPYQGGSGGTGPTIRDVATALPDDTLAATVSGRRALDVDIYLFRLGPTLFWELTPRWSAAVGAGAAVGLVSGDLRFRETLSLADGGTAVNSGSIGGSDVIYGGYLNGTLLFHVEQHGDLYLSLQYMPLSEMSIRGPGRQADLIPTGGVFVSFGVNWPF